MNRDKLDTTLRWIVCVGYAFLGLFLLARAIPAKADTVVQRVLDLPIEVCYVAESYSTPYTGYTLRCAIVQPTGEYELIDQPFYPEVEI